MELFKKLIDFRERKGGREQGVEREMDGFAVPLIYALKG